MLLPLFLLAADLALQLALTIAQRCRALEVLVADSGLFVHVHGIELTLELGDGGRRRLSGQTRARARLINHIDRLVGKESVGDVALR